MLELSSGVSLVNYLFKINNLGLFCLRKFHASILNTIFFIEYIINNSYTIVYLTNSTV